MEGRTKPGRFFDTGGKGGIPSSRDGAALWWVCPYLTSVPRLLLTTHLAVNGPTPMADLARMLPTELSNLHPLVKAMAGNHVLETWIEKVHLPGRFACGQMKPVRVAAITDIGRRYLWRYGWVTRRVYFSDFLDYPLRDDVPSDPMQAIRECVRVEFLRPASLSLAFQLALFGATPLQGLYRYAGNRALTFFLLHKWREAGVVGRRGRDLLSQVFNDEDWWELTPAGRYALKRHVDAMRRVCAASGYVIERECEIHYPVGDGVIW